MNQLSLSKAPKRLGTVGAHRTNQKAKAWMLTFNFPPRTDPNNLTAEQKIIIQKFNTAAQVHPVTYCVFQGEVGEHGTYHLQAYAEFAQPVTMPSIKKHFGLTSLHCEIRVGTQEQAIAYCTKEETRASEVYEYGTPSEQKKSVKQGSRTDLEQLWSRLKKGSTIYEIIDEHPPWLRYVSHMQKGQFEAMREMKRTKKTVLTVLFGPPGTGKTSSAIKFASTLGEYFLQPNDGKQMWWNGYDPMKHKTVILDEFSGSHMPLTFLNQLADKYELRVQTKGGFLPFVADHLVICSNFHPHNWYEFSNHQKNLCWEALERRIDNLVLFRLDIDVGDGDSIQSRKVLHVDVQKGGFNKHYVSSSYPLDCPPTEPNSPELRCDSPPLAPIPNRTYKGKRKVEESSSPDKRRREYYDSDSDEVIEISSDCEIGPTDYYQSDSD